VTAPLAALEVSSGIGLVASIIVLGALTIAWIVSLFMLVADSISFGAKLLWFIALVCLAPIAVPAYLWTRSRRRHAPSAVGHTA
jgi:hypothetical protein